MSDTELTDEEWARVEYLMLHAEPSEWDVEILAKLQPLRPVSEPVE